VFWGGIWGLIFCSVIYLIPGIGTVFFIDPIIGVALNLLEGAVVVGGLMAIAIGIYSMVCGKINRR
jgi:hypothetical protein